MNFMWSLIGLVCIVFFVATFVIVDGVEVVRLRGEVGTLSIQLRVKDEAVKEAEKKITYLKNRIKKLEPKKCKPVSCKPVPCSPVACKPVPCVDTRKRAPQGSIRKQLKMLERIK